MAKMDDSRDVMVYLTYFLPDGSVWRQTKGIHSFRWNAETNRIKDMNDVVSWVRGHRTSGGQWGMPGLPDSDDYPPGHPEEGWNGFILIQAGSNAFLLTPEAAK